MFSEGRESKLKLRRTSGVRRQSTRWQVVVGVDCFVTSEPRELPRLRNFVLEKIAGKKSAGGSDCVLDMTAENLVHFEFQKI